LVKFPEETEAEKLIVGWITELAMRGLKIKGKRK
jgi:hypothetical protein